ncbi:nuclear envelope pore membrane protein POM 121C [Camelus dromedarius]|uniref:nuclear envelope pore membrane protein POM 121C n=1 Tax=Camelus dromedarius TaxID=9838 RepID=UPI0031194122
MGDYLSTPCPSAPPRALGGRHLPRGPGHLQAAPRHRRLPLAGPGHPALHQLLAARRPAYRCPVTLHRRLVTVLHRRCSLLPRTLRSFLGVLISTCSRVRRRRAVLRAQTSTLSCSSASPVGTAPVCAAQEQPRTPVLPTTPGCALGSCAEAVSRAPGESGEGLAKQGEDPAVPEGEDQRSPDGTGGEEPEMRHLWVQRGPISFIPRPGSLQRNLRAKNSEDRCVQKPQTSCVSSCPRRNVISSSYSSSRGSPPVRRKRGPAHSELPPKSLKKGRKESPRPPAAALVVSPWTNWPDRDADTVRGPRGTKGNTSDGPRPRRRRFPLLPHRRGEPLRLPPPPELGFPVTGEDLNMEKKAAFRQINSMLRGETEAGLAPPPSPDAEVTSMGTTPPSQPLLSGAPQTTSGSILPPLQTPQTAPMGALAFDTPAQETGVTPINNTAPSQPLLSGAPQTTSGSILPPLQAPQTAPSGGLAVFTPACDSGVTPMDSTPPSQPLLLGAPQTTSGSILPPLQAPQTAPSGGLAFFTPACDSGVTPMDSTPPSQPLLLGAPQTTSGSILPPLQAPQTAPSGGLAFFTPASDSGVTPMDSTPPSQPLLSGAPQTSSGSILPPLQAPQTAPSGALAFVTPAQGTGVTPMNSTVSSQPLLSGAPQTTSGSILPPLQAPQTAPSGGLAVFTPACDSGVTPMDSTPPSQPLLSGAPQTTSGSILPPLQAPQTAPSGALAFVTPAQGTGVTPMNSTVPSQPLLSGAPQTTSGNILPPLQAPQTASHDGVALIILTTSLSALSFCGPNLTVTLPANPGTSAQPILAVPHGQQCGATTACDSSSQYRKQAAPAPTSDSLSAPGLLAFRPPPKASSDGLSSRNPTMGTHASTQPISSATSTVFPHGSAAAAYMPSVVTRAGPNAWRHCPRSASSSPVPCRFGVSATCKGGRSQMGDLELCRLFAALSITGEAKRSPSTTRCRGGRRGLNTWGPVHQSTPMLATGPSTKQQPGFGGTAAPILSPTPGGAPRQSPSASSRGPGTSHSKAGMSVLACGSSPACAAGTGMSSHTVRARSSPVQGVAAHKAAGPSNKSSSSRLGSPPLESKRQMMA